MATTATSQVESAAGGTPSPLSPSRRGKGEAPQTPSSGLARFFSKAKEQVRSVLQGKLPDENEEFERNYNRVLEIRKDLQAIESGVKKWLASARTLSANARVLAKAMGTSPKDIEAYGQEMDGLLDDLIVLKSVTKKIGLMDEIIKQRHQLKDLRLVKENYERKLQQLEESDRKASTSPDVVRDYDVQMRLIQQKIAASRERYDALLTELSAAIAFFVKEAGVEGGTKLLAPELSAFRSSQFQFFLLCQKLIAGKDADVSDLEAQWKAFARRMSTTVANARSGVKKLDGKNHVMWRADPDVLPDSSVAEEDAASGGGISGVGAAAAKGKRSDKEGAGADADAGGGGGGGHADGMDGDEPKD